MAAATGTTVAEFYRKQGRDTLVVIDDIDSHKMFWSYSEREVVKLYGADFDSPGNLAAANSEMRAFYSALFQRVGYLNLKQGGGSLSMLLLVDRPALLGKGGGIKTYTLDDFKEEVYGGKVRRMWLIWLWLMLLVLVIILMIMMMMMMMMMIIIIIIIIIISG